MCVMIPLSLLALCTPIEGTASILSKCQLSYDLNVINEHARKIGYNYSTAYHAILSIADDDLILIAVKYTDHPIVKYIRRKINDNEC